MFKKRLLPFLEAKHKDGKYIFWPDLAKPHYTKITIPWMNQNINFVPKKINPPNVPQARPIENFWGDLQQKVYQDAWTAKTERQLTLRIKSKLKEFDTTYVESIMMGIKKKVKDIADKGVYYEFEKLYVLKK